MEMQESVTESAISLEERLEQVIHSDIEPLHGPVQKGMYACDMHVHSNHSHEIPPLEEFSPLAKMVLAFERGMHYFVLTDHNSYSGVRELKEQLSGMGPTGEEALKRFIPGVEVEAYAEWVGHAIHINVFGLSEPQWETIDEMYDRDSQEPMVRDFQELLHYLREEELLFAFNHAFWKPMERRKFPHMLKRIIPGFSERGDSISLMSLGLIFPEFPLIELNGSRIKPLDDLAEYFALVHGIPTIGGSDDHYTIPLASTYTLAKGNSTTEYLDNIARGESEVKRRNLDEDRALEMAEHVIEIFFGGSCDTRKYSEELINTELPKPLRWLLGKWKPRYLPRFKKQFDKLGAKSYLQSQYSCLPSTWLPALWWGKKTPAEEALDRLKQD